MARWGMVIDLDRCTGCQACVVACKAENNVPFIEPGQAEIGRTISWMEVMAVDEEGEERPKGGGHPGLQLIPRPCMMCDNPPCTKVCPTRATYINKEGTVGQIYPRCIGCRYCTAACPYTVKYFNWYPPEWPGEMREFLNPDVSPRPKGVVEKCTFCHHRYQKIKEQAAVEKRPIRDGEYLPACAQTCPTEAIIFGDLDDPHSAASKLARSPRAFRLMEDLGTHPKVIYLREEKSYE